jgi:hypothetical protein
VDLDQVVVGEDAWLRTELNRADVAHDLAGGIVAARLVGGARETPLPHDESLDPRRGDRFLSEQLARECFQSGERRGIAVHHRSAGHKGGARRVSGVDAIHKPVPVQLGLSERRGKGVNNERASHSTFVSRARH